MGVIHVQLRPGGLYIVLCCQPKYSARRSVPLWLCCKIETEDFKTKSNVLIRNIVHELSRFRDAINDGESKPSDFFSIKLDDSMPISGIPSELVLLRASSWLASSLLFTSRASSEIPGTDEVWLATAALLRAVVTGDLTGSIRRPASFCFPLEGEGRLFTNLPDDKRPIEFRPILSRELRLGSLASRGVADEELIQAIGLEKLLEALAKAIFISEEPDARSLDDLFHHLVPLELVPHNLVRPDEFQKWGEKVGVDPAKANQAIEEIHGKLRRSEPDANDDAQQPLRQLMAALVLGRLASTRQGDRVKEAQRLLDVMWK